MAIGTALAVAGAGLLGSAISANSAGNAADAQTAAAQSGIDAQLEATKLGIDEQRSQFDEIQKLLSPYVDAGQSSLIGQLDLLGVSGGGSQQQAIAGLEGSPQMQAMIQQGENAMRQNASATGGLRGGNTQAALAQFRPQVLSQLINQQYERLGGIASLGQNAAAGVGNAGMSTGANISGLLQASGTNQANLLAQQGAAQAGNAIAQGNAMQSALGSLSNAYGAYRGF